MINNNRDKEFWEAEGGDGDDSSVSSSSSFADIGDDEDDGDARKRKRKSDSRHNNAKRQRGGDISFVSSTSSPKSKPGRVAGKVSSLNTMSPSRAFGTSDNEKNNEAEVGAWQKHTKGIGLKYLQKFGFKGRLGKEEDGIAAPIEAVVHGANTGLGFGKKPRQAESSMSRNRTSMGVAFEEENDYDGIGEDADEIKESAASIAETQRWKKNKKTAHRNAAPYHGVDSSSIIDMRGGEVKTASTKRILGEELLHNLDLAYDIALSDRVLNEGKSEELRAKMSNLMEGITDVTNHIDAEAEKCARLNTIITVLHNMDRDRISNASAITTSSVSEVVRDLHLRFPNEFKVFGLVSLVRLADSAIVELSTTWVPSIDQPAIKDIFKDLTDLATHFRENDEDSIADAILGVVRELCETYYLGSVRGLLSSMDMLHPEPGIFLLHTLTDLLGEDSITIIELANACVVPRLRQAISDTDFSGCTAPLPMTSWVLPWRTVLVTKLGELESDIRLKLIETIDHFDTNFIEMMKHVQPWSKVLDEATFKSMVLRNIMPKYIYFLRNELAIRVLPPETLSEVHCRLEALFSAKDVVPKRHFDALMKGEFFPALFNSLEQALDSELPHKSVMGWLVSCRNLLGDKYLQNDQEARFLLAVSFKMIEKVISGDKSAPHDIAKALRRRDYFSLIESANLSARTKNVKT